MSKTWGIVLGGLSLSFIMAGQDVTDAAEEAAVFELKEVSAFEEAQNNEEVKQELLQGQYAFCQAEPSDEVKKYPKLNSSQAQYGSVSFDASFFAPNAGLEFHFVIDASVTEKADKEESPSLLDTLAKSIGVGSSEQKPVAKYDRLYFDANHDLDLTNDPVLTLMEKPPAGLLPSGDASTDVEDQLKVFEYLTVKFDHGPKVGTRPLRVLPVLEGSMYGGMAYVKFLLPVARKGDIRIGNREYTALLAQANMITGRFDRPATGLYLTPKDGKAKPPSDWGMNFLSVMRKANGRLYTVKASPTGDKLIVEPYLGDFGFLEVRPGGRNIDKLGASGFLLSEAESLFTMGEYTSRFAAEKKPRQRLPVGNYQPMMLTVDFGRLEVSLMPNYYAEDGTERTDVKPAFSIAIRKDEPYVLDFSNKPKVTFISPRPKETFKPGDEVDISAMLVDQKLDLMIRDIKDTTKKERDLTYHDDQGNPIKVTMYASLDPTVTITNSSGKRVANGTMPFG